MPESWWKYHELVDWIYFVKFMDLFLSHKMEKKKKELKEDFVKII